MQAHTGASFQWQTRADESLCKHMHRPSVQTKMWGRNRLSFSGKHVVVTGGSTGIGLALCMELVRLHANVTLIARTGRV